MHAIRLSACWCLKCHSAACRMAHPGRNLKLPNWSCSEKNGLFFPGNKVMLQTLRDVLWKDYENNVLSVVNISIGTISVLTK